MTASAAHCPVASNLAEKHGTYPAVHQKMPAHAWVEGRVAAAVACEEATISTHTSSLICWRSPRNDAFRVVLCHSNVNDAAHQCQRQIGWLHGWLLMHVAARPEWWTEALATDLQALAAFVALALGRSTKQFSGQLLLLTSSA